MKLVEIKNSLAKLYYEPADFPLVLADFLTVDDGNQKILAQVVSIESTNRDTTNCAILKFSLNLNADNTHAAYSGYVPPLDALVSKTPSKILASVFNDKENGIKLGKLTSTANINLNVNSELTEKFLYIQSDVQEETEAVLNRIVDFNDSLKRTTAIIDFDNLTEYNNANIIELGKDFKLPIDKNTLNYIYENDLTGLTVEQKAIVQDILLEIQDYIDTLEDGCIPFATLLNVVNDIYESDKSTGIILLRNKLLKYNQLNIFASAKDETDALKNSISNNIITVLSVKNAASNWQKEAVAFLVDNINTNYCLVLNIKDDAFDYELINKIHKSQNIKPVIASRYDSDFSSQLKSFAKNLILFKPQTQQKAFATYNSFLNKMAQGEFIVSGVSTYYTPLIVKELPEKIEQIQLQKLTNIQPQLSNQTDLNEQAVISKLSVETEGEDSHLEEAELINDDTDMLLSPDIDTLEEIQPFDEEMLQPEENPSELKNIFDDSLEQEIAKDVDKMFYAEAAIPQEENTTEESNTPSSDATISYDDLFSDEDLDMLDANTESDDLSGNEDIINLEDTSFVDADNDLLSDSFDDLPDLTMQEESTDFSAQKSDSTQVSSAQAIEQSFTETESLPGVPVYKTEIDEKISMDNSIKIAEGNIVYHEKYGRGVVEQLIKYGNKTLCSIQFDNVGRRLLDPNLADLKQM